MYGKLFGVGVMVGVLVGVGDGVGVPGVGVGPGVLVGVGVCVPSPGSLSQSYCAPGGGGQTSVGEAIGVKVG